MFTPSVNSAPGQPGRSQIILRWIGDLLVCFAITSPLFIAIVFTAQPMIEREDLWRFVAMPPDDDPLVKWAASQPNLPHFRVERSVVAGQLLLRYEGEEKLGVAHPEWESLGYRLAELVSSRILQRNDPLASSRSRPAFWAIMLAGMLATAFVAAYRIRRASRGAIPLILPAARPQPGWWKWLLGATAAVDLLNLLQTAVLRPFHIDPNVPDQFERSIQLERGWSLIVATLAIVLAVPLAEELLFRGLLLGRLDAAGYGRFGVAISAVLFTLFHNTPAHYIELLGAGVLLACLYQRTKSLWPSIACTH